MHYGIPMRQQTRSDLPSKAGQVYFIPREQQPLSFCYQLWRYFREQQGIFCRFAVSILESGRVAFRDLLGGQHYLYTLAEVLNSIRSTSDVIDNRAQFEVKVESPRQCDGTHHVFLKTI